MMMCPWCFTWHPLETYTMLQSPPHYIGPMVPVYKHGGPDGCKKLFPLVELA